MNCCLVDIEVLLRVNGCWTKAIVFFLHFILFFQTVNALFQDEEIHKQQSKEKKILYKVEVELAK